MAKAVATAASTALPPWRNIATPASDASGWADVTSPCSATRRRPRSGASVGAAAGGAAGEQAVIRPSTASRVVFICYIEKRERLFDASDAMPRLAEANEHRRVV